MLGLARSIFPGLCYFANSKDPVINLGDPSEFSFLTVCIIERGYLDLVSK